MSSQNEIDLDLSQYEPVRREVSRGHLTPHHLSLDGMADGLIDDFIGVGARGTHALEPLAVVDLASV